MNENQDLLNLCKLNLMEEHIADSESVDRDTTMKAIDWEKRQTVTRILNNPSPIAPDAMKKHYAENTIDGVYPWTDTLPIEHPPAEES